MVTKVDWAFPAKLLWGIERHSGLRVKCPLLSDFYENLDLLTNISKFSNVESFLYFVQLFPTYYLNTDGRTEQL
jgi:hypothetical protein